MSEQLSALWYAAKATLEDEPQPEEWFRFYVEKTLRELCFVKTPEKPVNTAPRVPSPPPIPKFNAQSVNLAQMRGFNPLQAARQMGLGQIQPSMPAGTPPPMPKETGDSSNS
jgi:hypothetical protein